jgi:hypothetical protein
MRAAHLTPDQSHEGFDLEVALRTFHQLALQDGDLGAEYWYQVGEMLRAGAALKARLMELERELATCRRGWRMEVRGRAPLAAVSRFRRITGISLIRANARATGRRVARGAQG